MQLRVRRIKTFKTDWIGRRRLVQTDNILECIEDGWSDGKWKPLPIVDEEIDE